MTYQIEYRYKPLGMDLVRVDELGNEVVTDSWNPLTGLTKCTTYQIEDREEFAGTMALSWAYYVSSEDRDKVSE